MTAEHVNARRFHFRHFPGMHSEQGRVLLLHRVQQQPRHKEIIGQVSLFAEHVIQMLGVGAVDLRQESDAVLLCHSLQPGQDPARFRFVPEIAFTCNLGGIGKGIQADDPGTVGSQGPQGFFVVLPYERGLYIEVQLGFDGHRPVLCVLYFQVERVPEGNTGTVGKFHAQHGEAGFPEVHVTDVLFFRYDDTVVIERAFVLPERVPVDEEVTVRGSRSVLEDILEHGGAAGYVVEDDIQHQGHACLPQHP